MSRWRRIARWLVAALAILGIVLTLLPLIPTDHWFIRLWDFPRLQVLIMMVGLLAVWLVIGGRRDGRYWGLAGALVAASAWQATFAAAYLPVGPRKVQSVRECPAGQAISLLNINVLQDNRDFGPTLALVEKTNPDVVLFLETDPGWAAALAPLHARYAHVETAPIPNTYGMILMSRLPMRAVTKYRLQPHIPSIDAVVTMRSGQQIELFGLHPEPPLPGDDSGERDAELVMAGRDVRKSGRAAIVLGDLNDVAWSDTSRLFREVSGTADPRVGRGLYPTFHAKYPLFQWPLDHMFVTPHWRLISLDRMGKVGSDHYPIFYRFCLAEPAGERLTAPRPDAETREEAREETAEGIQETREEGDGQ